MIKGITCRKPAVGINNQEALDQVDDFGRTLLKFFVLKMVLSFFDFVVNHLSVPTLKRQVPTHENVEDAAEGPDVAFAVIVAHHDLGCHVVGRTSDLEHLAITFGRIDHLRQAKIDDF